MLFWPRRANLNKVLTGFTLIYFEFRLIDFTENCGGSLYQVKKRKGNVGDGRAQKRRG